MDALTSVNMRLSRMKVESFTSGVQPSTPVAAAPAVSTAAPSAREIRAQNIAAQVQVELAHRQAVQTVSDSVGGVTARARQLAYVDEIMRIRGIPSTSASTMLTMLGGPAVAVEEGATAARHFGTGATLAVGIGALTVGAATALILHRNDE